MKRYDLEFPLRHPAHVIDHVAYRQRIYRIVGWGHPWVKAYRSMEELFINLRHGQWSYIGKAIANRFSIIFRGRKF